MGVFDSISFTGVDGQTVTIARPSGPLEDGAFTPSGTWVPADGPQTVDVVGFGLTEAGDAYFQSWGAVEGDAAELVIDPSDGSVRLVSSNG